MGEILGLGISHYPPLAGPDERMAFILKLMLKNPKLPESLRDPAGWPEAMRAEWGNDEGVSAAKRHRERLVGAMTKVREALDDFKPDFVLIWGDDQYENFKEDVIPPYCVNAYDSFKITVPNGNVWKRASGRAVRTARPCRGGQTPDQRADRGRLRHGLFVQAAAPRAGPRLRQRRSLSGL